MASGIRATVTVAAPAGCPIAAFSADATGVIDQVSTSVSCPESPNSVTEFLADADSAPEGVDAEAIFSYGSATLFRIEHDGDPDCPCEYLGRFGCPVHRYAAEDGDLTLVFHAEDFEQLQAVMAAFREVFPSVDVRRLLHPPIDGTPDETVFVDRGRLTDRQHEVLRTAFEMGYFERPKGANATEIAEELDIAQSTFTEHLVAAQRKILADVLEREA